MLSHHDVYASMSGEERNQLYGYFDIERYLDVDVSTLDHLHLHKLILMINDRIEVLWENTWIDGYVRESTEEELREWSKLSKLSNSISEAIAVLEKKQLVT